MERWLIRIAILASLAAAAAIGWAAANGVLTVEVGRQLGRGLVELFRRVL